MYAMLFDHCPQEGLTKGQFMYLPISVDECLTSFIENCKIKYNLNYLYASQTSLRSYLSSPHVSSVIPILANCCCSFVVRGNNKE